MPAWLTYALLRVGVFGVAFAVLLLLGLGWFWSAVIATVLAFCLAFILFRRQRDAVAAEWSGRRRSRSADEDEEDAEARVGSAHAGSSRPGAARAGSAGAEGESRAEPDAEDQPGEGRQL